MGEGGGAARAPKIREKYLSGNYRVKFGHFVNFFIHVFSGKNVSCAPKLTGFDGVCWATGRASDL